MSEVQIKKITAEQTHPLRHEILRPHQSLNEMKYPNDDWQGAFHLGAFLNEQLSGIISVYPEDEQGQRSLLHWRVRGMAVHDSTQGYGVGGRLLKAAIEELKTLKAELVWCNARTTAIGFYTKNEFQTKGDEFEIEGIGPHYIAYKIL